MKRRYFIAEDLAGIKSLEQSLLANNFENAQLHVYSWNDALIEGDKFDYHEINDFQKRDVWRSGIRGLILGTAVAIALVLTAYTLGWTSTAAGWIPIIFLAVAAVGFFTWEGGLHGIQEPNKDFSQFADALKDGKHVFFVDYSKAQESILEETVRERNDLIIAKDTAGPPAWMISGQTNIAKLVDALP